MTKRAKKGGEYGANGEWYEGGKFINTVKENPKKDAITRKPKASKEQYEPYKWEVPPTGQRAIFHMLMGALAQWADGDNIKPFEKFCNHSGISVERVQEICDRYNQGERWFAQSEFLALHEQPA